MSNPEWDRKVDALLATTDHMADPPLEDEPWPVEPPPEDHRYTIEDIFGNEPDPPRSVDLAGVLDEVEGWLRRFVVFPNEHAARALALWIAYTHIVDGFDVAPYMLITAPEVESGKTRLMEVAQPLTHKPLFSSSMTAAVLFRTIHRDHPTLFMDEADNTWTGKADEKSGELVALLNAGHRRGVPARRMGGNNKTTLEEFDVFGPKCIAGAFPQVDAIPEALRSRSIHLRLQRKKSSETVERFTRQVRTAEVEYVTGLAVRLAEALDAEKIGVLHVELIEELSDRDFDIWEPLLAIAQHAGGRWPALAVDAAIALCAADPSQTVPLRIVALRDVRDQWIGEDPFMLTQDILANLHAMADRPWGDYYGAPITAVKLANLLKSYGIHPKAEPGVDRRKGYYRQDLIEYWERYAREEGDA